MQITDTGTQNTIELPAEGRDRINGKALIRGNNNVLTIGQDCVAANLDIEMASDASVHIGGGCALGHLFIYVQRNAHVVIGNGTGFNGLVRLLLHEAGTLRIGSRCLFGGDIDVTISDMHSIVDIETGLRTNPAQDVVIGDHVWIGQRAVILKGSQIQENAVVATCAVVNGLVPANAVAAGVPARVVRTGVTWQHDLI